MCILCFIAVGVESFGQGAAGIYNRAHQRKIRQIEADLKHFSLRDFQFQRICDNGLSCSDGHFPLLLQIYRVESAAVEHRHLVQCYRFGAAVIVKGQPQAVTSEGHMDGIADGDIPGVSLRAVLRHTHRISPHTDPM